MANGSIPDRVSRHLETFNRAVESRRYDDLTERFARWSRGGSGTMTMRWAGDLLAELEVAFDPE